MSGELLRKLIHIGAAAPILLVPLLRTWGSVAVCGAAVFFNLFILPRTSAGKKIRREDEGFLTPVQLFPLAVLLCLLAFQLHVAVCAWVVLSVGDGMSALAGRRFGRRKLPWNDKKTVLGSVVGWFSALLCVWVALKYCTWLGAFSHLAQAGGVLSAVEVPWGIPMLALASATAGMLLESIDARFNDNLTVPFSAAITAQLVSFYLVGGSALGHGPEVLLYGAGVSVAMGLLAILLRVTDASGALAGGALAWIVYATLDWKGFALLFGFVMIGAAATRVGYSRKKEAGAAQAVGGRRGARNALANLAVPVALATAYFAAISTGLPPPWPAFLLVGFVASVASAFADTIASEIGLLSKREPVLITRWRTRVPAGENGAVSWLGLLAASIAAAAVPVIAFLIGLGTVHGERVRSDLPPVGMVCAAAGAFFGMLFDSLLGATVEGKAGVDNEVVNLLSTIAGAAMAMGLLALVRWSVSA